MKNLHNIASESRSAQTSFARAFTLIEMLIAVTLVLLMMVLFAEIFSLAADAMNLQRGISENDQQVRTLTTVLRNDLQKRTFRNLVPFFPSESIDDENSSYSFGNRTGYFYLSTNDPVNGQDNLLQFTVRSTIRDGDPNDTPYFGAAATLPGDFLQNQNQPEHDDGDITPNGATSSSAAEVCYFMRGDKLYRRQLLLRDPLPSSGATNPQPTRQSDGAPYFTSTPSIYGGEFWTEFDLSAIGAPNGAFLLGLQSLNNENNRILEGMPALGGPITGTTPLGQSCFRFGFDQSTGLSREFGDSTDTLFIGRFTHEETSAPNFHFPQSPVQQQSGGILGNGNPFDADNTVMTDTRDIYGNTVSDGIVDQFEENIAATIAAGSRRGEDLLLTNVHEFTVKVWDDRLQEFVPLSHSQASAGIDGEFNVNRQLNSAYAPVGGSAAIFDTWHPTYDRNGDSEDTNGNGILDAGEDANSNGILDLNPDLPPFLPMKWDPNPAVPPSLSGRSGTDPAFINSNGIAHWQPDTPYNVGDIVFPQTEDLNYNGILDSGEDIGIPGYSNTPMAIDDNAAVNYLGRPFAYRCIQAGRSGAPGFEPAWRKTNTAEVYGNQNPGFPAEAPPTWETVENLVPLKAIQITVRFLHLQTNKMRQITLVHSMTAK